MESPLLKPALLFAVILVLLMGASCSPRPQDGEAMRIDQHDAEYDGAVAQAPAPGAGALPQLYVCGDSISVGYGPSLKAALSGEMDCVHRRDLDTLFPEMEKPAQYSGLATSLIPLTAAVLESEEYHPDALLLNCGLHDIARGQAADKPAQYEQDLHTLIQLAKDHGVTLVWVQTTPKASGHPHNEAILQFNDISRRVMAENNVPVIDLHAFTVAQVAEHGESAIISEDGVHFTPFAQEEQGVFIAGELRRILAGESRKRAGG